jgi:hypothetical protein
MKASGLTSTGRNNRGKEELDEESRAGLARINQNDAEIDQGINDISRGLDDLADIAGQMREVVRYFLLTHTYRCVDPKPK